MPPDEFSSIPGALAFRVSMKVKDVTDAITAVRDACCHIDSFKKLFDTTNGSRGEFMVAYGKQKLAKIGDFEMVGEYDDDTAVFYGRNRVYLGRHIVRAFNEAVTLLRPLLEQPPVAFGPDGRPIRRPA